MPGSLQIMVAYVCFYEHALTVTNLVDTITKLNGVLRNQKKSESFPCVIDVD